MKEDQHFYIRLFNLRSGNRNEYLCGKGDISDDAYVTTAEIHSELAPSYSVANDEFLDDTAPPRYSVTAREILSALKSNKNLRRPSWFQYDDTESSASTNDEDDEFYDAVSHIGSADQIRCNENEDYNKIETQSYQGQFEDIASKSMNSELTSETVSDEVFISTDVKSFGICNRKVNPPTGEKRSVEFSTDSPTSLRQHHKKPPSNVDCFSTKDYDNINPHQKKEEKSSLRLICPSIATVMILDDDHHGIFSLTERSLCLTETVGTHYMFIIRCGGSRGKVTIPYRTEEGTAKPNRDYHHCEGVITFENGETE